LIGIILYYCFIYCVWICTDHIICVGFIFKFAHTHTSHRDEFKNTNKYNEIESTLICYIIVWFFVNLIFNNFSILKLKGRERGRGEGGGERERERDDRNVSVVHDYKTLWSKQICVFTRKNLITKNEFLNSEKHKISDKSFFLQE